ncbi:MAG: arylsulfatase [Bacteroidales bacterium]
MISTFVVSCSGMRDKDQKPNILLILADDLGYSDIACYGGDIETPNLDNLASDGIMFTHFYNSARCNPSRASLLTGLHPHQTGMGSTQGVQLGVHGYMGQINENCVTIAEVLGEGGYKNYAAGKWHLTHSHDGTDKSDWPLQRGFDRFFGTIYGAGSFFDPRMLYNDNEILYSSPEGFYYTDAISDTAIKYIDEHYKETDDPFFLYVAYTAPHWPMHAKPADIEKYKGKFDKGWDALRPDKLERMKSLGLIDEDWDTSSDVSNAESWEQQENKEWELNRMEVYAAMIDCMDQGIGRIIEKLDKEKQLENTLVLFLSDNGACAEEWGPDNPWAKRFGPVKTRDGTVIDYSNDGRKMAGTPDTYYSYGRNWSRYSNTPFSGHKSSTWEGGIATPFIVYWPGKVKTDSIYRDQLTGIIDIMPTLVAVSNSEYPENYNGNSIIPTEGLNLMPAIIDNERINRDYYFVEHIGRNGIIAEDGWKGVKIGRNPWQLFNIFDDRTEVCNKENKKPDKMNELANKWQEWADRCYVLSSDSLAKIRQVLNE